MKTFICQNQQHQRSYCTLKISRRTCPMACGSQNSNRVFLLYVSWLYARLSLSPVLRVPVTMCVPFNIEWTHKKKKQEHQTEKDVLVSSYTEFFMTEPFRFTSCLHLQQQQQSRYLSWKSHRIRSTKARNIIGRREKIADLQYCIRGQVEFNLLQSILAR